MERSASLVDQLGYVTDPRRGEPIYPLVNVLFMMICGVIAGADDFVAIARFGVLTRAPQGRRWLSRLRRRTMPRRAYLAFHPPSSSVRLGLVTPPITGRAVKKSLTANPVTGPLPCIGIVIRRQLSDFTGKSKFCSGQNQSVQRCDDESHRSERISANHSRIRSKPWLRNASRIRALNSRGVA
ncbi:hypothetical protein Poly21_52220 [Allorhodopirellula heiligendammensis]|uniref:H repeat-associated protein N-terminal domain-containing protein n=1 Tax=Allorhodopirellula heiligendammensis TaxID=2714739 RepID=A0A5C6BFI2_9BACT|nr:hypothetical protein Poly21_52220 [Allorhodopirellula heiligendammensis]